MTIYFSDVLHELRAPATRIAVAIFVAGALAILAVHYYGPRPRHLVYARPAARVSETSHRVAEHARREMGRRWFVLGEDGAR